MLASICVGSCVPACGINVRLTMCLSQGGCSLVHGEDKKGVSKQRTVVARTRYGRCRVRLSVCASRSSCMCPVVQPAVARAVGYTRLATRLSDCVYVLSHWHDACMIRGLSTVLVQGCDNCLASQGGTQHSILFLTSLVCKVSNL